MEFIAGIPFCSRCIPSAQAAYARHSSEQRTRWMQSMSRQIAGWRQTIMTTSSAAATVGIAAGATTGALIAGAASLVQGVATGAVAAAQEARASSPLPRPALPPGEAVQPGEDEPQGFVSAEDLRMTDLDALLGAPRATGFTVAEGGGTDMAHAPGETFLPNLGLFGATSSQGGGTHVGHAPRESNFSNVGLLGAASSLAGGTDMGHAAEEVGARVLGVS